MKTIANVMCVLNEAEFLEAAIRSVLPGVDQLIVIDQGSTDGTQSILERLTAEIVGNSRWDTKMSWVSTNGQTFLTRGEQFFRNLAIDLCFCDWLMITDGDEIMGDGWAEIVRSFINDDGAPYVGKFAEPFGAIRGNYWQMIGTSGYHTPDSPLTPEGGMRPLFFRKSDTLRAGDPMSGTKCHTSIVGIDPPLVTTLNVDLFHMGYAKSDMTARFARNIERGDWTALRENEPALKAEFMKAAREEPLNLLPQCVQISEEVRKRMPASIREPKFDCDYDPEKRRILTRRQNEH